MPDRVAEIENRAVVLLALILFDDLRFDRAGGGDDLLHQLARESQKTCQVLL